MSYFFEPQMILNFNINKYRPALAAASILMFHGFPALAAREAVTRSRFLMGTLCEVTAYGDAAPAAITSAFEEIARLEQVMSAFKDDSELSRLNRTAAFKPFACSATLWEVLSRSDEVYRRSQGAFDPTAASPRRGFHQVRLWAKDRSVSFAATGIAVDLGGIGKGFALDAAADRLKARGIRSALLNFGGQILAVGAPPGKTAWEVVVPGAPRPIHLRDASISTSSLSENPGHIRSPRTGRPIERPGGVAVILPTATEADAWSTAAFVAGIDPFSRDFEGCLIEIKTSGGVRFAGKCPQGDPL
ncbi:MAG: FAD:protein FMN transferase [Elusimicrobia bacterium]|nr:FAD:protein FMN transferase [Elusimicrobiota bacterium]